MNLAYSKLTIIIVLFEEKKDLLFKCLENIKNFKIVIIDNAANSKLKSEAENKFNIEKYILNKKNLGFTKAANLAIKLCNTDYILNINADCLIKEKDILLLIESHKKYKGCFVVSPTFYNSDLELTYNAGSFLEKNLDEKILDIEGDICVDKVLGSAILFKKKDIIELGFLDETFFLYYVDDDLCRQIKKKGMSVIQIYNAKAQHLHGQSKVKNLLKRIFIRNYHFTHDQLYYYFKANKHQAKIKYLRKKLKSYIIKLILSFILLRFSKSIYYIAMIKALYDFNKFTKK
jgi:N-acetylglucosaminyl-diphospho-decaprenol L-rhamnosyltransferase